MLLSGFVNLGKSDKQRKLWRFSEKSKVFEKKKKTYHFTSALVSKDMLRIVKGFASWILFDCLRKSFYIRWSAGRSPRVHEVNPGRDPSKDVATRDMMQREKKL